MNYFIVGDIHGCIHALKKILKHWDSQKEQLIFVGDYINKGKHSKDVIQLVRSLQKKYPQTICIKGNHEYEMSNYIKEDTPLNKMKDSYADTLKHYDLKKKYREDLHWMNKLPLTHENNVLYISHAGVNMFGIRKFNEKSMWSVLRYRGKLKKMKKMQVIGHTPTPSHRPEFSKNYNCLNIDTGAGNFEYLTAVVIDSKGNIQKYYNTKIEKNDR